MSKIMKKPNKKNVLGRKLNKMKTISPLKKKKTPIQKLTNSMVSSSPERTNPMVSSSPERLTEKSK